MRSTISFAAVPLFALLASWISREDSSSDQHVFADADDVSLLQSHSAVSKRGLVHGSDSRFQSSVSHTHAQDGLHAHNSSIWGAFAQTGQRASENIMVTRPRRQVNKTDYYRPKGVISNVYNGAVVWADVWVVDLHKFILLTLIAYPVLLVPLTIIGAVLIGMLLATRTPESEDENIFRFPAVTTSQLTERSQYLYSFWCTCCRLIPAVLVFAIPCLLFSFSIKSPQEVYSVMLLVSSTCVYANGLYMSLMATFTFRKLKRCMNMSSAEVLHDVKADEICGLMHWVILPNFCEDEDILAESIEAVAKSTLTRTNICLLLAMESAEDGAEVKSNSLCAKFENVFKDILVTFHPTGLPNDPPGKASNVAWAFKQLTLHLEKNSVDESNVMLTVADADTIFHELYFEALSREFFEKSNEMRHFTIWQSVVLHMKNYHRQPGPVAVGTMFTAMTELAFMSDPHATKFPYSSYSISCKLASTVGGWDPEWIAEDWHMGIKCFLFTLGRSEVQPLVLPTTNYTPEDGTYFGTCRARWLQAKRHSLGFSDLSYYFMMLPLVFLYTVSAKKNAKATLADFWFVVVKGLSYLLRLVNSHAIIAHISLYAFMDLVLKFLMEIMISHVVHIQDFFHRTFWAGATFAYAATFFTFCVTIHFMFVYGLVEDRIEKPQSPWGVWVYGTTMAHWTVTALTFLIGGPIFFFCLAASVWCAAARLVFASTFKYEVAAKPTKELRAG